MSAVFVWSGYGGVIPGFSGCSVTPAAIYSACVGHRVGLRCFLVRKQTTRGSRTHANGYFFAKSMLYAKIYIPELQAISI